MNAHRTHGRCSAGEASSTCRVLPWLLAIVVALTLLPAVSPAAAQQADEPVDDHLEFRDDAAPREHLWKPAPRMSPAVIDTQIVGLETWLAIDDAAWVDVEWERDGTEYVAVPVATIWEFSDQVITCDGPGVAYTPGAAGPAPCGREWFQTTDVAPMQLGVRIEYSIDYVNGDEAGTYRQVGLASQVFQLDIGEIQTFGVADDEATPESLFREPHDSADLPQSVGGIDPVAGGCEALIDFFRDCAFGVE